MNKQILLLTLVLLSNSLVFSKKIADPRWVSITKDIARDGDSNDRGELELAIQAFKNIEKDRLAEQAATAINENWGQKSTDPLLKNDAQFDELMKLERYPQLVTPDQIKNATIDLFEKPNIDKFLKDEGFIVNKPTRPTA